jgi:hypothetical protein
VALSLAWVADGIERAERCGGVPLETYRKPGFTGGSIGVRRARGIYAEGFEIESDPEPWDDEDELRGRR